VEILTEINTTLKAYLEKVVSKVAPDESKQLIEDEKERLHQAKAHNVIIGNRLGKYLVEDVGLSTDMVLTVVREAKSWHDLVQGVYDVAHKPHVDAWRMNVTHGAEVVCSEFNRMRVALGLPTIEGPHDSTPSVKKGRSNKSK
jgi:thiamine biosynthesis lipoprotein ApbE